MNFTANITKANDEINPQAVNIETGEVLFIVGANGTGKTGFVQDLTSKYRNNNYNVVRIHAQRHVRIDKSSNTLTAHQYRTNKQAVQNQEGNPTFRHSDTHADTRLSLLLYELVKADNDRAHAIATHVESDETATARTYAQQRPSILTQLNMLVANAGFTFSVSYENETFNAKHGSGQPFAISQLSDGERASLLMISEVLIAPDNSVIIVDEPERHLHRSISAPLLTSLLRQKNTCAFIVATHDIDLVLDMGEHRTILVRGVMFQGAELKAFDYDVLGNATELDEKTKYTILGARRVVAFTEGETNKSLDTPMYAALFPNTTFSAVGPSREVINAVRTIRSSEDCHWVKAFGVIDGDFIAEAGQDKEALREAGVFVAKKHSIESFYYGSLARGAVAKHQAQFETWDAETRLKELEATIIAELGKKETQKHLASYRAEANVRGSLKTLAPTRQDLVSGKVKTIKVDISSPFEDELSIIKELHKSGDVDNIIEKYKIRETGVPNAIARMLGCQDKNQYHRLVIHLVKKDSLLRLALRAWFDDLAVSIS